MPSSRAASSTRNRNEPWTRRGSTVVIPIVPAVSGAAAPFAFTSAETEPPSTG